MWFWRRLFLGRNGYNSLNLHFMKKAVFFEQLHEFLEVESIETFDESTNLKELDEYDSLMVMAIIAFIDDNFSTQLTAAQLKSIGTVNDLMDLVGNDKFAE